MTTRRLLFRIVTVSLTLACGTTGAEPDPPPGVLDFRSFDQAMETATARLGLEGASAVVVHRDHGIVHLRGYGSFARDRVFLIASSSKPVSVGVLMRLADQGLLDIDAPIGRYVDLPWGDGKAALTVAQLVSNSSGLVGLLDNPVYLPYRCQYSPAGTLDGCAQLIYGANDATRRVPPDTRFRYGGGQWQLAGGIAEVVSGRTWAQLVHETYVEPCGTASLAYTNQFGGTGSFRYPAWFQADPSNAVATDNPNIEAGAFITVEDYGRILLMHLRGGVCGERRVLSASAVTRMQQDRIAAAYAGRTPHPHLEGYGLGWWIDRAHAGVVASPGLYGALPWLDLPRGYGVFIALEASATEREELWAQVRPILERIFTPALSAQSGGLP